jgi:uncharacterized membrane protein YczE
VKAFIASLKPKYLVIYVLGILCLGLAVALLKRGNLGVPPWDTSTLNLQSLLKAYDMTITVGQSSLIHTTGLLILTLFMTKTWKALYALLPMILVSQSIDLFDIVLLHSLPVYESETFIQISFFVSGTLLMTFGLASIMISGYPPNIYDAFQLGLMKTFRIQSFTQARWILEFSGIGLGIFYAVIEGGPDWGSVTLLSIGLAAIFGTVIKIYIALYKRLNLMNRDGL